MAVPGPPEACRESASSVPVFKEGRREKRASVPEVSRAGAPRVLLPVRAPVFLGIARYRGRHSSASRGTAAAISRHAVTALVLRTYYLGRPQADLVQRPAFLDRPQADPVQRAHFPDRPLAKPVQPPAFLGTPPRPRYRGRISLADHWPSRYRRSVFSTRLPDSGTADGFSRLLRQS